MVGAVSDTLLMFCLSTGGLRLEKADNEGKGIKYRYLHCYNLEGVIIAGVGRCVKRGCNAESCSRCGQN